jgi:transposase InsO family protein
MKKSLANKLRLKERLYTIRMAEGTSIQSHLNEFNSLIIDLEKLDVKIDDEDKAILLVVSLPATFNHFKEIMLYGNQDTLSFENVKSNLLSKEKFDVDSRSEVKAEGLIVRGRSSHKDNSFRSKSRSKSRDNKSRLFCRYCKKTNHEISQCLKLKNKEARSKKIQNEKFAEASFVENESDGEALISTTDLRNRTSWIIDSACTFHICPYKDWFSTYDSVSSGEVVIGDESPFEIVGIGSVQIKTHDGTVRTLTNVRHVPRMKRNLISLGTIESLGYKYAGGNGVLKISKGNLVVLKANRINSLYHLQGTTVTGSAAVSTIASDPHITKLWHMRLGHMSEKGMHLLCKKGLLDNIGKLDFCEHCVFGKQKRVSFSSATHQTKGILDYIHSDLWGKSKFRSLGGCEYMITFIDDSSRKVWVYFLKHKNDAFSVFQKWKALVENQTGRKIKKLRTDNGLEFCSGEFDNFCANHGIARHLTVPGTPQQNGVAERMNRTLLERARCMLSNAGLWHKRVLWAETISTACYLINRSPNSAIDFQIPEEVWSGKPVDYSNLRIFGCPAYAHVSTGKLEPRARKCIFVGYGSGVKGYRLWCSDSHKLIISRDVTFNEDALLSSSTDNVGSSSTIESEIPEAVTRNVEFEAVLPTIDNDSAVTTTPQQISDSAPSNTNDLCIARDRTRRNIQLPARYRDTNDMACYALLARCL